MAAATSGSGKGIHIPLTPASTTNSSTHLLADPAPRTTPDTVFVAVNNVFNNLKASRSVFSRSLAPEINALTTPELDALLKMIGDCTPTQIEECLKAISDTEMLAAVSQATGTPLTTNDLTSLVKQFTVAFDAVKQNQPLKATYATGKPNFIDNLLLAFSYFSADHEPEHAYGAIQTLQIYAFLALAPFILTSMIDGVLDDIVPGYIHKIYYLIALIGVIILTVTGLGLYRRYYPVPNYIRPMRNYGVDALESKMDPLLCRDDVLSRIFACWQSSNNSLRRHPLLVGPAGVGKSVIMFEVARRIATTDVPQALKKEFTAPRYWFWVQSSKKVFGGASSALIADQEGGLDRFMRKIQNHRKDIVVMIDEIHAFFTSKNEDVQGEFLKSLLDTGPRGLPFMLAATTQEEYNRYIAHDSARARRFEVIYVEPLNSEQATLTLRQMAFRRYPTYEISEELLKYVYEQTEVKRSEFAKNQQPEVAARVLAAALANITNKEREVPSIKALHDKEVERLNLYSRHIQGFGAAVGTASTYTANLAKLDAEIASLQTGVQNETDHVKEYEIHATKLSASRQEIAALATKVDKAYNLRRVAFLMYYMIPYLRAKLAELRTSLGIPILDKAMIDQTINDFIETERRTKAQEAAQAASGDAKSNVAGDLKARSAAGNDKTLATDGDSASYLYSVTDVEILTRTIRSTRLTYQNEGTPFKAPGGEEFSHLRENDQKAFVAPPYHYDNFAKSFAGDIATITAAHRNVAKNNIWSAKPELLVIPFLKGAHWYVIRIEIDYTKRSASILWDDPMGYKHFDKQISDKLTPAITASIRQLMGAGAPPTIAPPEFKDIDQQGVGENGTDCGPITISNIVDYLDVKKPNATFAAHNAEKEFTVKKFEASDHKAVIKQLRATHKQQFVTMTSSK